MNTIRTLFLTLTLLAALPGHAMGDKATICFGVQDFPAYLPYSSYVDDKYSGFNRELLDMFGKATGMKILYKALPIKRKTVDMLTGQVDAIYPDNPRWQARGKKDAPVAYSDPVVDFIDGVFVLPKNVGLTLSGKAIGIPQGYTPTPLLSPANRNSIRLTYHRDIPTMLKLVLEGRLDGAYLNVVVGRWILKNDLKNPKALVYDGSLPHFHSTRHVSTRKRPELIKQFNAFLKSHAKEIDALKKRYSVEP